MPPEAQDPSIFQDPATAPVVSDPPQDPALGVSDPAAGAPPAQDPLEDPRVQLAIANARNEALQSALQAPARQDPVPTAAQPPLPADPLDLLTPAQKAQMENLILSDPVAYGRAYADLAARLERARLEQQAAPMIASQGATFVELFKGKMARVDAPLFAQIEPLFDTSMRGLDLRPLVQMTPEVRENELLLRWRAAKAQVLEKNMSAAPPRPDPRLTAPGGGVSTPGGGLKKTKVEEDRLLGGMAAEYKFTPEQLAELEEIA